MKSVLLLTVVAMASASGFLELESFTSNVGSNCETSLTGYTVDTFTLNPWPPARQENVTMAMTGTFETAGTLNGLVVNVKYNTVPFYQLVIPRSAAFTKGESYKDSYTAFFPSIAPSGSYAVALQLRNTANQYLNCWQVTFTL